MSSTYPAKLILLGTSKTSHRYRYWTKTGPKIDPWCTPDWSVSHGLKDDSFFDLCVLLLR